MAESGGNFVLEAQRKAVNCESKEKQSSFTPEVRKLPALIRKTLLATLIPAERSMHQQL